MGDHVAIEVPSAPSSKKVSPKVKAGAVWGVLAMFVLAVITAITPDMLDVFGQFKPMVYSVITMAATLIGAWLRKDGLRELGGLVMDAQIPPLVVSVPTPAPAATVEVAPAPVAEPVTVTTETFPEEESVRG